MDLSIVILNYNTKELTLNCINSIFSEYKKELDDLKFEIILVDNNSEDESLEAFKKLKIKGLKLIESKENLGFSKGCNLGASKASGKYILFLNSDTEIKDQGFVKMVDYLNKNENVAILGGKLKNSDGTSQPSAGNFYNLFNLFFWLLGFERLGFSKKSPNLLEKVDWVSGASLMIRKNVFEKIGEFEKQLFMYIEDMDLCFKARKKGFLTYFYPEITLFHSQTGSSNRTFAILNIYKGILFFYKKYKPGLSYGVAKTMLFSKAFILKYLGKLIGNKYLFETYAKALEFF